MYVIFFIFEMDLIQQYTSDEDEDFFDGDDDEWCQDIPLQAPSPKRARLDEDDEQIGGGPAVSSPLFQFISEREHAAQPSTQSHP